LKIDPLILKRFEELEVKAAEVEATKAPIRMMTVYLISGSKFQEWATSVMNILQRVFGEKSIHYKNFSSVYASFRGYHDTFENCYGIFLASKGDFVGGYLFNLKGRI
jgi:hypothetical protein